jgi:serine/threonine-protein kinase
MGDISGQLHEAFAGRYEIEREVGAGGMATVYRARDLKHERTVAIKILKPELASALGRERFPREIKIIAQLSHPHILPLHDSGETAGFLYYVMPFVEGESLRAKLDREGPLSAQETVRILRGVADALAYAHAHGVVHRDIKPDNVMISGRHAIVTDFGVAKAVSAAGGEALTTVGIALGTPSYMAPEQATGDVDIDHRADIYALGVLAYEMLTGQQPFHRPTAQATLAAQVLEEPEPPSVSRPGIAPGLDTLIMRCLAKEKAKRWQSAEELVPQLETFGTPSGGMTPTDTRPVKVTAARPKFSRRAWLGLAAAAVVVALGAGSLLIFTGGGPKGIEQIAVLPIQDLSGDDQVFVDAVHDALISALARTGAVGVVSRSAVMRFRGGSETTEEVARDLGVQAVVEGTVFRAGDRMRINVQMVEPETLRHLWTQSYERDVDDVLAVQDEVVAAIAEELSAALASSGSGS